MDGDSASSTEIYAILSALSGLPLRQDLAVTGSVDQHGTIQAIGAAQVWVGFNFETDSSFEYEGAYIDEWAAEMPAAALPPGVIAVESDPQPSVVYSNEELAEMVGRRARRLCAAGARLCRDDRRSFGKVL